MFAPDFKSIATCPPCSIHPSLYLRYQELVGPFSESN
nr:MAG TPA: hypothetical protein [Caudoviricetes sp.]